MSVTVRCCSALLTSLILGFPQKGHESNATCNEGEIAMSLGMSRGLVKEYMEIIKKHQEDRKVIS